MMDPFNTSAQGFDLIKDFESLRLDAYKPTPDDVWTIGWGHTTGVKRGDTIDEEEARYFLRRDVKWAEYGLTQHCRVPLTQGQVDALVSFIFNLGAGAFKKSTLLRQLNKQDYQGAHDQLLRWVYQGKTELAGLVRRRKYEQALFRAGTTIS